MASRLDQLKHVIGLYAFLLVVWGFYRALFKLPEEVEELVLKPIIWLGPLYVTLRREGLGLSSVGWTGKNLAKSLYLGVGLGVLFAVVGVLANAVKYGGTPTFSLPAGVPLGSVPFLAALGISLASAVSEETVFRGFIFARVWKGLGREWAANILTSVAWAVVHLPVLVFVYKLGIADLGVRFALSTIFGIGSAFVFARTGNISSSILLHVFWSWPIILFR